MRGGAISCCLVLAITASALAQTEPETIEFPSEDQLTLTADVYWADKDNKQLPFICLFHQAGWSRGEYREIAPRLVEMGYNCMAIDCRSGDKVNGVINETVRRLEQAGKRIPRADFNDAYPDIVAALQYARANFADGPLIAWGSSYSASLVLRASADNEGLVDGTLSFAPNDRAKWTRAWIMESAEKIKHPVFITSGRVEKRNWKQLADKLPEDSLTTFLPQSTGQHGSRVLWKEFSDSAEYWTAVKDFLAANFPTDGATDGSSDGATPATALPAATSPVSTAAKAGGPRGVEAPDDGN